MEGNTFIMKVSMPFRYFQYFVEDAKENYRNNYWFKIAFEEFMYAALSKKSDESVLSRIELAKLQLLDFIDEKYAENEMLKARIKQLEGKEK